jgi:hypothetical protein
MEKIYDLLAGVECWEIKESDEAKEQKKNIFSDKKLSFLEGNYEKLKNRLETFPPDGKFYGEPFQDVNDPWVFYVYTEGHLRLRIQARYDYWSKTCTIEKVLIDIKK